MAASDDGSPSSVVALSGNGSPPANSGADASQAAAAPSSARDVLKAVEAALVRLATLKVVTVVGDVSVAGMGGDTAVSARPGGAAEAASTEVSLLDGHIVNVFSPGFAGAGGLQAFHQSQVEKSGDILLRNLAELQKLAGALAAARR